jgi:signal transduction histidine kinase
VLSVTTRRKQVLSYLAAVIVPILALFFRWALERKYGDLPYYVFFYPVVLLVAMLGDAWSGLLATTTAALLVVYWVLPPVGQFTIGRTNDAIGLAIFCMMGVGVSFVAELYHRNRRRLAAYEKSEAVWEERRKSEEALRKSEERFRALVTASSEVMYRMSPDWSEMRQLRGGNFIADTEAPSRTWLQEYIHPDDQAHVMTAINEAIKTKSIFELEHRVMCKDGSLGWTHSRAVPLLDSNGEIIEWFGAASDITDRKKAEHALIRSEKLAATGRLAATIAHEVNNPLEATMSAAYIASTDPAKAPQMLTVVNHELRRAAHITQQTVGLFRESKSHSSVALSKVFDEVLAVYATKLQHRNITVHRRFKCNSCREACDDCFLVNAGEFRQIISTLLANGVDALRNNGTLHIHASRLSNSGRGDPRIQLTLADNGCGIPPENLKRIFEPFFTTKEGVGTGLGLWVTQELVRKHNGAIKVRSREGKGTVFRITFPAMPSSTGIQPDSTHTGPLDSQHVVGL